MKPFKISIEQYRGTSYDIGYKQGQQIDTSLIDMFSRIINEEEINPAKLKNLSVLGEKTPSSTK